jgi:hypothetical protein
MENPLPQVHFSTWVFMRNIYGRIYHEKSLSDWLSDMRRAHSVAGRRYQRGPATCAIYCVP